MLWSVATHFLAYLAGVASVIGLIALLVWLANDEINRRYGLNIFDDDR